MESLATDAGAAVRYVIVNADDFGASSGVNRGIIEAHACGIVTSTSLMVRGPAACEAVDCTSSHPQRDHLGVTVDLGRAGERRDRAEQVWMARGVRGG